MEKEGKQGEARRDEQPKEVPRGEAPREREERDERGEEDDRSRWADEAYIPSQEFAEEEPEPKRARTEAELDDETEEIFARSDDEEMPEEDEDTQIRRLNMVGDGKYGMSRTKGWRDWKAEMSNRLREPTDVIEVFSPPRVTLRMKKFKELKIGRAIDLTHESDVSLPFLKRLGFLLQISFALAQIL